MISVNYTRSCVEIYSPQNITKNRLLISEKKKWDTITLTIWQKKKIKKYGPFNSCLIFFSFSYNKTNQIHQFLKLILECNSTCFGHFLCPSSGVFHCTHSSGICHTGLIRTFHPVPARKLYTNLYDIPLLCVQWKTPHDGQRNCPKHVEFHSKINLRN